MGGTITEKELEKYDYLRAEYYKGNRKWPYTPRPLTNYEKAIMSECIFDGEYSYLKRKTTYADFYLSDLYTLAKPNNNNESLRSLLSIKDKLKSKVKIFPRQRWKQYYLLFILSTTMRGSGRKIIVKRT